MSTRPQKQTSPTHLLREGAEGAELWRLSTKGEAARLPETSPSSKAKSLVVAPPTNTFLCLPLWVSPHGDDCELAGLELASRHLLRKGHPVSVAPIRGDQDRRLILAVMATDDDAFASLYTKANCFEATARLWPTNGADLILWRESGQICFGFYREGLCIYFSATGQKEIDAELGASIYRCALRLCAEEMLATPPATARLYGFFTEEESACLEKYTGASTEICEEPPPRIPENPSDFAPPGAVAARARRVRNRRAALIGSALLAVYLVIIVALAIDFGLRALVLDRVQDQAARIAPAADIARDRSLRWLTIRRAVDPSDFLLDILASVVRSIPAENMRLTQLDLDAGTLTISGEAADVAQANEMLERLRVEPALAEYDWLDRGPEIASREIVRFQFEGRRANASTDTN